MENENFDNCEFDYAKKILFLKKKCGNEYFKSNNMPLMEPSLVYNRPYNLYEVETQCHEFINTEKAKLNVNFLTKEKL